MTPDANNLYIGAGDVYFDRFDVNGAATGLRHLGNSEMLDLTPAVVTKEKLSSMDGTRGLYREIAVSASCELTVKIDEYAPENLALALLGTNATLTQTAAPALTDQPINGGVALALDVYYDLGYLNAAVTAVKQGATPLDPAAYTVQTETGMIKLNSKYAGANPATAAITTWSGSAPAIAATANRSVIQALSTTSVLGRLRYIGAANQATGPRLLADFWRVQLNPDGSFPLISEDYGQFSLKGKVQLDLTKAVGARYFQLRTL